MTCDLLHLGDCVVEALFDFIFDIFNSASKPFLSLIYKFMHDPVNISVFADIWRVIVYILSLFYGLLLVWIGLKFIISGESPEQREKAKSDLKNIIIMMVLVQGSYYLYDLILAISSALTKTVLNMTGISFFQLSMEGVSNFAFNLIFGFIYILHLLVVLVILLLRYVLVSSGVIFFAIGIFFYFISPLQNYGKLILNSLGVLIFLPFAYSIFFLVGSRIVQLDNFRNYKVLIMVGTMNLVIIFTALLLLFVIVNAATKVKPIVNVVKAVA